MDPNARPTPISDADELPDDMDLDDRAEAAHSEPAEGAYCLDLDIASAQRPPSDS